VPIVLQTEIADCGHACLAMISSHFGNNIGLRNLRSRYPVSEKGTSFKDLIQIANELGFSPRALTTELSGVTQLRVPCILHWEFNHFVVLSHFNGNVATIHDPTTGVRKLTLSELSRSFTGAALELSPTADFRPSLQPNQVKITHLLPSLSGLGLEVARALSIAFCLELLLALSPLFMQFSIDHVIPSGNVDLLLALLVALFAVSVFQQLLTAVRATLINRLRSIASMQLTDGVFTHLLKLPVGFFDRRSLGTITSSFTSVSIVLRTIATSALESIVDGVFGLIALGVLAIYSPLLALVSGSAVVVYIAIRIAAQSGLMANSTLQAAHFAKQQTFLMETIRGFRSVSLFGRQSERKSVWLNEFIEQANAEYDVQRRQTKIRLLAGCLFSIEKTVSVGLAVFFALSQQVTIGALFAILIFREQFVTRSSAMIDRLQELKMLDVHADRVAEILLEDPESLGTPKAPASDLNDESITIEFQDVSFRYSDTGDWVLKDVSFTVVPGEFIGVRGVSGGGKTTLLKLLVGITIPTRGRILVNGIDLHSYGISKFRRQIAAVLNDDRLFAGTIAENISFFENGPDLDRIVECARKARIHREIKSMPLGYHTLIGDLGNLLSSGQQQRILIARALYHQPKVLLLDEATSNLDPITETAVSDSLGELKISRIVIAHRPSTIERADRIYHLTAGSLTEVAPLA